MQFPGGRIACQARGKLSPVGCFQPAVQVGVDQFDGALAGQAHRNPRDTSRSRKACRAVNRRDFTVLIGHSRMAPISS